MDLLDQLLEELVIPKDENSMPDINGVVAGFTDSKATQYVKATGAKNIHTLEPVEEDTSLALFSCTKPMTAMAALILMERGEIDLDKPAKEYLPELGEFGVIEEGDVDSESGELLNPPKKPENDVTTRHLLLNNSGFAYMFTDPDYYSLMLKRKVSGANPLSKLFRPEVMPLLFEPGTQWKYGHSMDWVGFIVEAVSGKKLGQFMKDEIFDKAGMSHSVFRIDDPSIVMSIHDRTRDGGLRVSKRLPLPHKPELDMGGQGCYSTVGDYLKFLRVWLNYGYSPDTGLRILKKETVQNAITNKLPEGQHVEFMTAMSDVEDFVPDGFTLAGMAYSNNNLPTGRRKGSIYWGGLANLYFWVDYEYDCAGFFGCQVLPYMDLKCLMGYVRFEYNVYEMLKRGKQKL